MTRRVFVTGGSGFIGRHLTAALVERGDRVLALARSPEAAAVIQALGAEAVPGDLRDPASIGRALHGPCDLVLHLGAVVDPALTSDEALLRAVHVLGTQALLGACARIRPAPPRVLAASSVAAMGIRHLGGGVLADLHTPCCPTTPYGRTKLEAEQLLTRYPGTACAIRLPTVHGPGERYNLLSLTRAIHRGWYRPLGRGNNRLSMIYVDNLVSAFLLLADADADQLRPLYLLDDGAPVTQREVYLQICEALGRPPASFHIPAIAARAGGRLLDWTLRPLGLDPPLSAARARTLLADFAVDSRPVKALGYRPRISLAEGLRRTVAWYRQQGLLL